MHILTILIIGGSAAGISAAKEIRTKDKTSEITILSDEDVLPYFRPMLTEYIFDDSVRNKAGFIINDEKWYADNRIDLILSERALSIDTAARSVKTSSGKIFSYDRLILANGSRPFLPQIKNISLPNIYTVKTVSDAQKVFNAAGKSKSAILVGGGLLGLEAAYSLSRKGVDVSIIEIADRLLPMQLDAEGSEIITEIIKKHGISIYSGSSIEEIIPDSSAAKGLKLSNGKEITSEMIVYSSGVRPNIDLALTANILCSRGVTVNEMMQTSLSNIFAAGDVAELNGRCNSLWMRAVNQGKVAGLNSIGKNSVFEDTQYPAILNSFGTKICSMGDIGNSNSDYKFEVFRDAENYRKLCFRNSVLSGAILIGDISDQQKILSAIRAKTKIDGVSDLLKQH